MWLTVYSIRVNVNGEMAHQLTFFAHVLIQWLVT